MKVSRQNTWNSHVLTDSLTENGDCLVMLYLRGIEYLWWQVWWRWMDGRQKGCNRCQNFEKATLGDCRVQYVPRIISLLFKAVNEFFLVWRTCVLGKRELVRSTCATVCCVSKFWRWFQVQCLVI